MLMDGLRSQDERSPAGASGRMAFRTRAVEFKNDSGAKLSAYIDTPAEFSSSAGTVVIAPAYGETKESNILISSYFAANGYHSVRLDWSDHVGESDGEIFVCTLSKMLADLASLVRQCAAKFPRAPLGIVATSLAGRVALKLAARSDRIDFLLLVAPVVNLQQTLLATYREDLIARHTAGKRYGTLDVLGFSIDADAFLEDAVRYNFADLQSSLLDAEKIKARTMLCIGEKDPWVQVDQARAVLERSVGARKFFFPMVLGLHRIVENPIAIKTALKRSMVFFAGDDSGIALDGVQEPSSGEVHGREIHEKAKLKEKYECSLATERQFWQTYLSKFQYIFNIHDYWNLLENIHQNLGGAWAGQNILDVGSGNGNYAYFLLLKQAYKRMQNVPYESASACAYYGLDFVAQAISDAQGRINELQEKMVHQTGGALQAKPFLHTHFIVADIDSGMPFESNSFDQICCNLVVSYLRRPQDSITELCRVLRPGGKLLISSLKPNADLSEIYRNFVAVAENEVQIGEARRLLSNAGAIKLKEVRGLYQFYSEKELKGLARRGGLTQIRVLRSFGNQANVVIARKAPAGT